MGAAMESIAVRCMMQTFLGVIAHITYTKSDGSSWLASSESDDISDWPAPPESTAEGRRF